MVLSVPRGPSFCMPTSAIDLQDSIFRVHFEPETHTAIGFGKYQTHEHTVQNPQRNLL